MKKVIKKAVSVLLVTVIVFGAFVFMDILDLITVKAAQLSNYSVGDIIKFGSYPQSEVTDEILLAELGKFKLNWISYDYYSGNGDIGSMVSSDYMRYSDIEYNGERYRAVSFSDYRPLQTYKDNTGIVTGTYQDDNGYYIKSIYWFKYEPIAWRVLDPEEGLVLCETIIDSQAYSNTRYSVESDCYNDSECKNYANDYATSSIREWLNEDFYNTAFTDIDKTYIIISEVDNSSVQTSDSKYHSETTYDKVFLLSYDDVKNSDYGLSTKNASKQTQGSEYAKCQGLCVHENNLSSWWLRTPGDYSYYAYQVGYDGVVGDNHYVDGNCFGVRPSLKINPELVINGDEKVYTVLINNNTGSKTINYGETLRLTTVTTNMPTDAKIYWYVDGVKKGEGETFNVSFENGTKTVEVKLVDADGNVLKNASGNEISDSEEVTVKAGFFRKLISFFKNLFGANRTVVQAFKSKF